ncbi:MAG: low temperature requirement protein A [Erythrobacter sp.]|jgi:low temperature requirement protein LtrA
MVKFVDVMPPRDPAEVHRASTPLELLFDLATVIAIAACAAGLHHGLAEGHAVDAIVKFAIAFFAVWWAWMNYTWFASAYDNNDAVFRMATFVIIGGAVTVASGIDALFDDLDLRLVIVGYVVMRLPLALLWLRAARGDPARRSTSLIYAAGLVLVQSYWASMLALPALPQRLLIGAIAAGFVLELVVPILAERRANTPWHHDHIEERYGLLTIIVLGEVLLAAALSLRTAGSGDFEIGFVHIAMSALVVTGAMWWLYFPGGRHLHSHKLPDALAWGYGHVLIFGAVASVGAGFSLLVDIVAGKAEASLATGDLAVGVPLALYMFGLWLVRDRHLLEGRGAMSCSYSPS